jgi:DNA helicase II / ATP-dependent DNA helicase PcrA
VDPTLGTILENIYKSKLFILPDALDLYIRRKQIENKIDQPQPEDIIPDEEKEIEKLNVWDKAMACPFSQLEKYEEYIQNRSKFGTHQGVKGLEFQRVMVILDDSDARGFMFSYGKMFGVAQPTEQDKKNIKDGRETSIQRTLRLFYVSCSRAQKSLAIVAYSKEPKILKERVLAQGWFENFEIIMI